jgi:hypothetical protein
MRRSAVFNLFTLTGLDRFDAELAGEIGLSYSPMTRLRTGVYNRPRLPRRVHNVREYSSRIPWSESFYPRNHKLCFPQRETVVVHEFAIAGNGGPWRHVTSNDVGSNLPALKPCLFVSLQWKRRAVLDVTHHTMLVQNADDLAIKKNSSGERLVRYGIPGKQH